MLIACPDRYHWRLSHRGALFAPFPQALGKELTVPIGESTEGSGVGEDDLNPFPLAKEEEVNKSEEEGRVFRGREVDQSISDKGSTGD